MKMRKTLVGLGENELILVVVAGTGFVREEVADGTGLIGDHQVAAVHDAGLADDGIVAAVTAPAQHDFHPEQQKDGQAEQHGDEQEALASESGSRGGLGFWFWFSSSGQCGGMGWWKSESGVLD